MQVMRYNMSDAATLKVYGATLKDHQQQVADRERRRMARIFCRMAQKALHKAISTWRLFSAGHTLHTTHSARMAEVLQKQDADGLVQRTRVAGMLKKHFLRAQTEQKGRQTQTIFRGWKEVWQGAAAEREHKKVAEHIGHVFHQRAESGRVARVFAAWAVLARRGGTERRGQADADALKQAVSNREEVLLLRAENERLNALLGQMARASEGATMVKLDYERLVAQLQADNARDAILARAHDGSGSAARPPSPSGRSCHGGYSVGGADGGYSVGGADGGSVGGGLGGGLGPGGVVSGSAQAEAFLRGMPLPPQTTRQGMARSFATHPAAVASGSRPSSPFRGTSRPSSPPPSVSDARRMPPPPPQVPPPSSASRLGMESDVRTGTGMGAGVGVEAGADTGQHYGLRDVAQLLMGDATLQAARSTAEVAWTTARTPSHGGAGAGAGAGAGGGSRFPPSTPMSNPPSVDPASGMRLGGRPAERAGPGGIEGSAPEREAVLRHVFRQIDKNGDGHVTRTELIRALRADQILADMLLLPMNIRQEDGSRDEFERVFQGMDGDLRGVHLQEFLHYFLVQRAPGGGAAAADGGWTATGMPGDARASNAAPAAGGGAAGFRTYPSSPASAMRTPASRFASLLPPGSTAVPASLRQTGSAAPALTPGGGEQRFSATARMKAAHLQLQRDAGIGPGATPSFTPRAGGGMSTAALDSLHAGRPIYAGLSGGGAVAVTPVPGLQVAHGSWNHIKASPRSCRDPLCNLQSCGH
jgi:hypothetical protein